MLGTLRFLLTALFLAPVLVFVLVSISLAVRFFRTVTHSQSVRELEREAAGLADLYAESALRSSDEGAKAPEVAAENLEVATGGELYRSDRRGAGAGGGRPCRSVCGVGAPLERRGRQGSGVRRREPRAGDGGRALLRRSLPVSRTAVRTRAAAEERDRGCAAPVPRVHG